MVVQLRKAGWSRCHLSLATIEIFIRHNRNSSCPCDTIVFANNQNDQLSIFLVEVAMNTASNVSVRAIPETQAFNPLMSIALLCALVLGTSFCLATFGLDISAGFF
jgi:hypothetical protein